AGRRGKGPLVVNEDPRIHRSESDRRTRQTALLKLYDVEKAIGRTRAAARSAASAHIGGVVSSPRASRLDQLQGTLTSELNQASALSRSIDGYSGPPTADQRRQIDALGDEVARTIGELNRLMQTDSLN